MFKELEDAVAAVKDAKAVLDAAQTAAHDAAVTFETAVTVAKKAHEDLTKFAADIVPGIQAQPKRIV